jgi:hypothetical protein
LKSIADSKRLLNLTTKCCQSAADDRELVSALFAGIEQPGPDHLRNSGNPQTEVAVREIGKPQFIVELAGLTHRKDVPVPLVAWLSGESSLELADVGNQGVHFQKMLMESSGNEFVLGRSILRDRDFHEGHPGRVWHLLPERI